MLNGTWKTSRNENFKTNDSTFVTAGGEGEIHTTDLKGPNGEPLLAKLYHAHIRSAELVAKLKAYPTTIPPNVIGPVALVAEKAKGSTEPCGFLMRSVIGHDPIFHYSELGFSEHIPLAEIFKVVGSGTALLASIHAAGMLIGDLNDLGLLVAPATRDVVAIDADSMQFTGHPCSVWSPDFLDPAVHWSNGTPVFTIANDYWSWAVLAFQTLFRMRPYGGTHPTLGPTARQKQKHSILRDDVVFPKTLARPWGIVSDDLVAYFRDTFEGTRREILPISFVNPNHVITCADCNHDHANPKVCPYCQAVRATPVVVVSGTVGGCQMFVRFEGEVFTATMQRDVLAYVYRDPTTGAIFREDGTRLLDTLDDKTHPRFAIMGKNTALATLDVSSGGMVRVLGPKRRLMTDTFPTGTFWNRRTPVVAADTDHVWSVMPGDLLADFTKSVSRTAATNATWIAVAGNGQGIAVTHAYPVTKTYLFTVDGQVPVDIPGIDGELVALHADASDTHVVIARAERVKRQIVHRAWLIRRADGIVVASLEEVAANADLLPDIHSITVFRDRVMTASTKGLAILRIENGKLVLHRTLPATSEYAPPGATLLVNPQGHIFVVRPNRIIELRFS